jgi:ribonuclease E
VAAVQSAQPEQATADQTRSDAPATAEGEQGNQASPRRSRRRRAPKRTRTAPAPTADRFGTAPDEIDTTPTDAPAQVRIPSAPVWSLQDDTPDTTPGVEAEPAAGNDSKPARKGWWQRTFSGDK